MNAFSLSVLFDKTDMQTEEKEGGVPPRDTLGLKTDREKGKKPKGDGMNV